MGRCEEGRCTNCGRDTEAKFSDKFPTLHVFRCLSRLSTRRQSCRYKCIRLKTLPEDLAASQRANSGTSLAPTRLSCFSDFANRSRNKNSKRQHAMGQC